MLIDYFCIQIENFGDFSILKLKKGFLNLSYGIAKGGLISEGSLTLVPLQKNVPNLSPEQKISISCLLSAQGRHLAPFVGNGTKV